MEKDLHVFNFPLVLIILKLNVTKHYCNMVNIIMTGIIIIIIIIVIINMANTIINLMVVIKMINLNIQLLIVLNLYIKFEQSIAIIQLIKFNHHYDIIICLQFLVNYVTIKFLKKKYNFQKFEF